VTDTADAGHSNIFRWLLSSERGLLSYSTGVARLKRVRLSDDGVSRQGDDLTLHHEMVHQLHALTTPFLFGYCENLRGLVAEFAQWLAADPRPEEPVVSLRRTIAAMEQALEAEFGADPIDGVGFSARQLLEGVASVEPLRPIAQLQGAAACLARLDEWVRGNPTYLKAAGAACRVLGPEDGLRLLSTLVFVALHTDRPGEAFATLLVQLNEKPSRSRQMTSADVIDEFFPTDYTSLIARFADTEAVSKTPLWNDAGSTFANAGRLDVVHLAAANPSSLLFGSNYAGELDGDAVAAVTPPVTISEDGQDRTCGVLDKLPEHERRAQARVLLDIDALTGVMLRLGRPERRIRNACLHTECPEYEVHLCSLAFPPPIREDWSTCMFRQQFRDLAGEELHEFAARYGLAPAAPAPPAGP
jgi:hypothetical protein